MSAGRPFSQVRASVLLRGRSRRLVPSRMVDSKIVTDRRDGTRERVD